jgi:hypothetical protein
VVVADGVPVVDGATVEVDVPVDDNGTVVDGRVVVPVVALVVVTLTQAIKPRVT